MAQPTFTLTAGDGLASRIGTTRAALAEARVVFTTSIRSGELVRIDDGVERIEKVVVNLDSQGKINGDTGIQLTADDPSLGIERVGLEWRVAVYGARSQGYDRPIKEFSFLAPSAGETVSLADKVPTAGQDRWLGYGMRFLEISEDGQQMTITRDDWESFTVDPIPEVPSAFSAAYAMTFGFGR